MAKVRSPAYPTIGLREAIEKVKAVYEKDYQNKLPRALVAEHMGYRSLNGKSLGVLSAVGKFGLLEGRGDESRVSDLALDIIAHPAGSPERARAVLQAASNPELFSDLDSRFQNGKVSDAGIKSYLLTQKFIPVAADAAIRSYRETKALVHEEAGGYSPGSDDKSQEEAPAMEQNLGEAPGSKRPQGGPLPPVGVVGEKEFLRGPLSRESAYRLMVSGNIGAKELGKIIKILTLQRELLDESEAEEDSASLRE